MSNIALIIFVLIALCIVNNNCDTTTEINNETVWSNIDPKPFNDRAKDFCSDRRALSVNISNSELTGLYELNNTESLLFTYKGVLFSVIDYIDYKSKLPVIESSVDSESKKFKYPQYIDKAVEHNMKEAHRYNKLTFVDYAFYAKKNDSHKVKSFIGFNQVWLNCPQPLPIDAQIDAIVSNDDYLWIFRGQYYWESGLTLKNESFRVNNAKHVSVWDKHLPTHLDASFTIDTIIFIFKGKQYATYNDKMSLRTRLRPAKALFGDKFPHFINAAFYNAKTLCAYIFKGDNYWIYNMTLKNAPKLVDGYPKHVNSLNKHFPSNLNAATVMNGELYIFRAWNFANFSIDLLNPKGSLQLIALTFRYIFTDFFHFTPEMYSKQFGFNSYNELLTKYGKKVDYDFIVSQQSSPDLHSKTKGKNNIPLTNAKTILINEHKNSNVNAGEEGKKKNQNNMWILFAIILSVITVFAVLLAIGYIVVRKRKKDREMRDKVKTDNVKTDNVTPGKVSKPKKLIKKVNADGSILLWKASSSTEETRSAKSFKIESLQTKEAIANKHAEDTN